MRRRCVGACCLVLIVAAASGAQTMQRTEQRPTDEQGHGEVQDASSFLDPPSITTERYTEDYSYLRDPAAHSGAWWEPLKFIPLNESGDVFVGIGDEVRLRYEHYTNNEFGSARRPTEGYLRFRMMPYLRARVAGHVQLFGELIAAYGTRPPQFRNPDVDQTGVDLLQGFAAWRGGRLTLRVGRQVLIYGSGRLINAGPNVRTSFDGAVAVWKSRHWRVDTFVVRPVRPGLESFDNRTDTSRTLWAVYTTRMRSTGLFGSGVDLFYIGSRNANAVFNQGAGRERRHTLGIRSFGDNRHWQWDSEAHIQAGRFNDMAIFAWDAATIVRYTFVDAPAKPFLEVRGSVLSGDRTPDDRTLGTFNALNPLGGYFGESSVIGPANLLSARFIPGMSLGSGWSVSGGFGLYARQSLGDALYGLALNVVRHDSGSRARFIATEGDASVAWAVDRNVSLNLAYSILLPGWFIKDTGPARTVHFVGSQIVFRF